MFKFGSPRTAARVVTHVPGTGQTSIHSILAQAAQAPALPAQAPQVAQMERETPSEAPSKTTGHHRPVASPSHRILISKNRSMELLKDCLKHEKKKKEEVTRKAVAVAEAEAAKKNDEWQKVAKAKEHEIEEAVKKLAELDGISSKANEFETALLKPLESL
ncbi:hypothetical protein FDZ73_21735 [bacterium]|nr:MAG: hypothetical protein FDZ73_21735 [bacterium]